MQQSNEHDTRASLRSAPREPEDRGTELILSTSRDVEQLVCARGALFLVTNPRGDIAPAGARELGLFYKDTRHLSHLDLHVDGSELVHLSSATDHDAFNQVDFMAGDLETGEFLDDPQNFLHVRRRQLLDDGLVEELTFTNFLGRTLALSFHLEFDADFADVFEVRGAKRERRGVREKPRTSDSSVHFSYRGLDGSRATTHVSFAPPPSQLRDNRAQFTLELAPGASRRVEVTVEPALSVDDHPRAAPHAQRSSFSSRVAHNVERARAFRESSTRVQCDCAVLQQALEQAAIDLYSLNLRVGEHTMVAAGIPWFCAPFGRDALIASYETLLLNPGLAKESLAVLAAYQGTRHDEISEEEPGKIFHELRFGEMARTGEMPHAPYYGTIDATPLFVVLAHATYKVTADRDFMQKLLPHVRAALAWIDARSQKGTAFVSYQRKSEKGLENQGWKDSRAGVSFPDGRRAEAPIALCEIQGYCVDAYDRGARILRDMGEAAQSALYFERSRALRELVNERFWLPERGRYAYAMDGQGRALDTVVSNLGHLLWSRVPSPERALLTGELLLRSASFSGFGVRTLAEGQAVYNPLSYHNGTVWPHDNALIAKGLANYRHTDFATSIFEGLVEALRYFEPRRLPELFCGLSRDSGNLVRYPVACSPQAWAAGAPYLLLQSILGIHIDAPRGRIAIRNPSLPPSISGVTFENMRIGASRVDLGLRRVGKRVHVDRCDVTGPALRAEIELD